MKIRKLWRQNEVDLAKIRHVFDYNLLTDVVLEHNLQIYSKAQWLKYLIKYSTAINGKVLQGRGCFFKETFDLRETSFPSTHVL